MNLDMNYTSCSYLFFTFITISLLHRLFSSSSRSSLPPGPQGFPILGHMHLLRSSLPRSLQALAHTYGPLMSIRIGSLRVLVVSDSDTAKQILKTHDPDFASKFVFGPRQFNVYKGAEFFNAPYGPYWRFMKKLCMTKLFAGYQLDRFVDIREEETLALLSSLVERSRNGEACDLGLEFTALTTKILSKMVMGKRCRQNSNIPVEIRKIVSDIMACATRFGFMELFGPLRDLDLFAPYGLRWKFMKRICMVELFSSRALDSFVSVRSEELSKLLIRVLKKAEAEESVNLGEQLKELTSNIITRMMFRKMQSDSEGDGKTEEVIKMVVELNELAGFFNVSETFWFLKRLDLQGLKKRLKNARDKYDVMSEKMMSFGAGRRSCPGEKMVFRFVPVVVAAIIQCFELKVKGSVEMNEGTGSSLPRATPLVCVPVAKEAIQSFSLLEPKVNFY
ncbi:unnamed protein product [Arabidopsis arenosa]|uniref:Uncharacterized protein n=1 Tax=Arabidopsis arenosa TaxID=38785 RepID=A0A8S2ARP1_ARAAE|nr:unnamed protein product [Arabidopsis arenosa]